MDNQNDDQVRLDGADLDELTRQVRELFNLADRTHGFPKRTYEKCFIGSEAVEQLIQSGLAVDIEDAERLGNILLDADVFHHVQNAHAFKNEYLFYRFSADEDHGEIARHPDGSKVSWGDFVPSLGADRNLSLLADIPDPDPDLAEFQAQDLDSCDVSPLDKHNVTLLDNVHPKTWHDPTPKTNYNLVAIGGGAGGLITSGAVAGMGGNSALIESHLLGGDCLNVGCVPSKALLSAAKMAATIRGADEYGIRINGDIEVDFAAVMERLRRLRAQISHVDSAGRYANKKGVDVFIGKGKFTGPTSIEVNGKTLNFAKAVIATGGSPAIPNIPGINDVPYLTNASIFNLTELPRRMAVIGAGPIGLELAQAFQRFGCEVSVFARSTQIMPKEDEDAVKIVEASMLRDGVKFYYQVNYERVESSKNAKGQIVTLAFNQDGRQQSLEFDALLIAVGRKPNVDNLGLEAAGVEYDQRLGVKVNDRLQTSNPKVFAVGDVCTKYQFTHVSDFMARIAVRNAVAFGRDKFSNLLIPWATYTDPEVAHVGLYPADLEARDIAYTTVTREFNEVDRAIVDGHTEGFVKMHLKKGSDEILGATIVGTHAGDMISEITLAIQNGIGLGKLANVIHPYPTAAEAIRQCGDLYNSSRLTPTVKKILNRLLAIQR